MSERQLQGLSYGLPPNTALVSSVWTVDWPYAFGGKPRQAETIDS